MAAFKRLKRIRDTETGKASSMSGSMVEEKSQTVAEDWVTYDHVLETLKELPPSLTAKDFVDKFQISCEGVNPHRWRKRHDFQEFQMEELFGKAIGPGGVRDIIGWIVKSRRCLIA